MDDETRQEIAEIFEESLEKAVAHGTIGRGGHVRLGSKLRAKVQSGEVSAGQAVRRSFTRNQPTSSEQGSRRAAFQSGRHSVVTPRRIQVSSGTNSNRLRVALHKAQEENNGELTDELVQKALDEAAEAGGLEVEFEAPEELEAEEPSAEDVRKADERWDREREALVKAGVPPAMVDSAEPILRDEDSDAQEVVRNLLKEHEGMIDFSERGSHVVKGSERDEAREQAQAWSEHDRGVKAEAS